VCQQSVGLLQRGLDDVGIPSVSITQVAEITRLSKPSLACFVAHPFGLTLGAAHERNVHLDVLRAVLKQAEVDHPSGAIVPLPEFQWPDDLRRRQLRKEAH